MRGLILYLFLSCRLVSFGAEEGIYIKEFNFDPQSKEFEISYLNSDQTNLSTLKTSSPIYLCIVNQLLHEYYQGFQNIETKPMEFSREHLKLINQVAYIVPEAEKKELRNAIKNYIKQFNKTGDVIFQALSESITHLLKNETLNIKEQTLDSKERKTTIENEIKIITAQIEDAKKAEGDEKQSLKKLWVRSLAGKKEKLSQLLKRLPKETSRTEHNVSALESPFCLGGKTSHKLLNEDPSFLLEKFTNEITKAFPESPYLKSKSLDTHFF
jgi:hypothetical protein